MTLFRAREGFSEMIDPARLQVCRRCLKSYKRSYRGQEQRELPDGEWGHGKWPARVYHPEPGTLCLNHRGIRNAEAANRRAAELAAMPPWADKKAIRRIYAECARITHETGVKHEVDHIHPLRGKRSCGLHVHWNMRIITRVENQRKGNQMPQSA